MTQPTLDTSIQSTTRIMTQSQLPSTHHQVLPSSSSFANSLICKEINTIKDELCSVKADIAMLDCKPTTTFSQQFEQHICEELKNLRQELYHLHKRLDDKGERAHSSPNSIHVSNIHNCTCPPTENQCIKITAWNCRGIKNAVPYLNQLIKEGTDIICVCEHWLWPYQITELSNVHQDFEGYDVAD